MPNEKFDFKAIWGLVVASLFEAKVIGGAFRASYGMHVAMRLSDDGRRVVLMHSLDMMRGQLASHFDSICTHVEKVIKGLDGHEELKTGLEYPVAVEIVQDANIKLESQIPLIQTVTPVVSPPPIRRRKVVEVRVNPNHTFEAYGCGPCNIDAFTLAKKVSEATDRTWGTLLFIHGSPGRGKTALVEAIVNAMQARPEDERIRVVLTSGETFVSDFLSALDKDRSRVTRDAPGSHTSEFRQKIRAADVWIMDAIDFVFGGNKLKCREELLLTISALLDQGVQIVITSEKPPCDLNIPEEALFTRLQSGLVVEIEQLDQETLRSMVVSKFKSEEVEVPEWVISGVVERVAPNPRILEGAVLRVCARVSLDGGLTQEVFDKILKGYSTSAKAADFDKIVEVVARVTGVPSAEFLSKRRKDREAWSRQLVAWCAAKLLDLSEVEIGKRIGGPNHNFDRTTVIHALGAVEGVEEKGGNPAVIGKKDQAGYRPQFLEVCQELGIATE